MLDCRQVHVIKARLWLEGYLKEGKKSAFCTNPTQSRAVAYNFLGILPLEGPFLRVGHGL